MADIAIDGPRPTVLPANLWCLPWLPRFRGWEYAGLQIIWTKRPSLTLSKPRSSPR